MALSPSDETLEILHQSLHPISDYSGHGSETTSNHDFVCNGVRDGAGSTVINKVTNIMITSHMGAEPQNSFKGGSRGPLYGK